MKLNWNTLLLILAAVAGLGPDLTAVSAWLQSSGIPHAVGIAHVFALGAAACAGLALAVPKLRGILAALGLATHPDNILPPVPADAPKSGGGKPPVAALLALSAGLGLLGYSVPARADINLDDLAPKLTKCWGTTCLQPAASVNAVMFDLSAKKWLAGTTALGAGLELLFYADQPYGFGPIAHLSGVIAQQGPSFALLTGGLVVARYGEIGYSRRVASDGPSAGFLSVALTLPWDVLASGKALPTRATEARMAAARSGQ